MQHVIFKVLVIENKFIVFIIIIFICSKEPKKG